MSKALVKYDAARRALAAAQSVDEVKDIRDKAEAMRAYARQAGDKELLWWATEIKLRAERKGGALLAEMDRAVPGDNQWSSHDVTTLNDLGVTKKQSARWQEEASISDEEFEEWLDSHKGDKVPTSSGLRNLAKRQAAEQENGPHRTDSISNLAALADSGQQFKAIYVDPPWTFKVYSGKGKSRSAENHYDTMDQEAIKGLGVHIARLAAKDCALFLWCVMPQIPEALKVIEAWGFTYKTAGFIWAKLNKSGEGYFTGMGYWTRANAELCILATRGAPTRLNADVPQLIVAPVGEHSRKPDETRGRIERLVAGPYLELFARQRVDGWTVWGNQAGEII